MSKMMSNPQKGHKQQGLAIVHVASVFFILVGIFGTIMIGKSLIETSIINKQVKQIQHYQYVTRLFEQKFSALPGDYVNSTGFLSFGNVPATGGNGNDIIGDRPDERRYMWEHLSLAGLLNEELMRFALPSAIISEGSVIVYYREDEKKHYFHVGVPSDPIGNIFTPFQAYKFDLKLDEGTPTIGLILAKGAGPENVFGLPPIAARAGALVTACITLEDPPEYQTYNDTGASCSLDISFDF